MRIERGDQIKIKVSGCVYEGTVLTANDYTEWDNGGWYIEFMSNHGNGYAYWKQGEDGGKIIELNGKAV